MEVIVLLDFAGGWVASAALRFSRPLAMTPSLPGRPPGPPGFANRINNQ
jgi:hypothetical protein